MPQKMTLEIIGNLQLQVLARLRPLGQEPSKLLDLHKQVLGRFLNRRGSRQRAHRIDQVGRRIRRAAFAAVVAILSWRLALRTCPFDKPIR